MRGTGGRRIKKKEKVIGERGWELEKKGEKIRNRKIFTYLD